MGLFRKKKQQTVDPAAQEPAKAPIPCLEVANLQGQGDRAEQQDAFGLSLLSDYEEKGLLAVLCDGMGGMEAGREIAQTCAQRIVGSFPLPADAAAMDAFDAELLALNGEIYRAHGGRGGSTLVLAYLREGQLFFRCLGDSDLFLLRGEEIVPLNEHQTYGNDLLRSSIPTGADAVRALSDPQADALMSFLGCENPSIERSRRPLALLPGDTLLLCSDGVSGTVSRQDLLSAFSGDIQAGAEQIETMIAEAAKLNQDNYTAIICRYNGNPDTEDKGGNHE